ncbi:MAG: glycosyltransferase family 4 protein, partial [Thermoplasmata archaeon]
RSIVLIQNLISISDKENLSIKNKIISLIDTLYTEIPNKIISDGYAVKDSINKKKKVVVILNGFDSNYLSYSIVQSTHYNILFMGRISIYQKGLDRLLSTFKQIKTPKLRLFIAGSGGDLEEFRERSKRLANRIKFLGRVDGKNKINAILSSDMLIITSRYESSPTTILEVNSLGKPVFALNAWGVDKSIINGVNGFLFNSEKELAKGIDNFYSLKYNERKKLSNSCRNHAKKFSWEKCAKETMKVYKEVLEKSF